MCLSQIAPITTKKLQCYQMTQMKRETNLTISKHLQLPEVVELFALGKMQRGTYRPMNDGAVVQ